MDIKGPSGKGKGGIFLVIDLKYILFWVLSFMFYGIKSSAFLLHETKTGKGGGGGGQGGGWGGAGDAPPPAPG